MKITTSHYLFKNWREKWNSLHDRNLSYLFYSGNGKSINVVKFTSSVVSNENQTAKKILWKNKNIYSIVTHVQVDGFGFQHMEVSGRV